MDLYRKYIAELRAGFRQYRNSRFGDRENIFEQRGSDGAVVFKSAYSFENVLIPPSLGGREKQKIVELVAKEHRHRHFGSMQSSQALVQSVFGTLAITGRLGILANVAAEGGFPAFGTSLNNTGLVLEKAINTLGEPRPTSIDVWLDGDYCVAIECKLGERGFGTCSRPRLTSRDGSYSNQFCDGSYSQQRERSARCALTEIGVRYWDYSDELFGWRRDVDHRPCPMAPSYQLVRNILASLVGTDGKLNLGHGHALVIYDRRNPTMMVEGGGGEDQWSAAILAVKDLGLIRRLSWQEFIAQWPQDETLDWLKEELKAKYGISTSI